eukprot:s133_g31.t1
MCHAPRGWAFPEARLDQRSAQGVVADVFVPEYYRSMVSPDDFAQISANSKAKGQPKYLGGKDSFAIWYSGLEKVTLQIPVKRAGSLAVAERIAELCYEQFELGHNKKEVTAFRDGLLNQFQCGNDGVVGWV